MICNNEKINPISFHKEIISKTEYMLRYDKYIQNLKNFDIEKQILGEVEEAGILSFYKETVSKDVELTIDNFDVISFSIRGRSAETTISPISTVVDSIKKFSCVVRSAVT